MGIIIIIIVVVICTLWFCSDFFTAMSRMRSTMACVSMVTYIDDFCSTRNPLQ